MKTNKSHTTKLKPSMFTAGFTLAETLVTMAIVGVLAAILIPTMISAKPNQEMVMLKKAYEITSRVINELINDDELYENEALGFYDNCQVTYHGKTYGIDKATCDTHLPEDATSSGSAAAKFCGLFSARMNLNGDATCNENGGGTFTTSDGMQWTMPQTISSGDETSSITVIVTPNRKNEDNCNDGANDCDNPNTFEIKFNKYGRITVDGEAAKLYLSSNKTTKTFAELKKLDEKQTTTN